MTAYRLPLPATANRLVQPTAYYVGKDRRIGNLIRSLLKSGQLVLRLAPTTQAREFRSAAHAKLPRMPIAGPVELYLTVTVPSIASDGPNREKSLSDALNEFLFYDDKQIAEWHGVKRIATSPDQVGVVVEVKPADPAEHRELAWRLSKSKVQELANADAQTGLELEVDSERSENSPQSNPGDPDA